MTGDKTITEETGKLFGSLWSPFDDKNFEFSVGLFRKRFEANGFDLSWFKGKSCLDAGCGGGRYCIAMAREGASEVVGIDVGVEGLEDARKRAADYRQLSFREASVLELPFDDARFDFVFCSGILHHTTDPEKGFKELCRVLKPGGKIFLLLYATGGVRWPAVMDFRECLKDVSNETLKKVMIEDAMPPNKIRTLIDDLKVPLIDFYSWEYVQRQLQTNGIDKMHRWTEGRLDHEENIDETISDMQWFERCFSAGEKNTNCEESFNCAGKACREYLTVMNHLREQVNSGQITKVAAGRVVIGQGHHRLIGEKV